jgi:hypothetical protein
MAARTTPSARREQTIRQFALPASFHTPVTDHFKMHHL